MCRCRTCLPAPPQRKADSCTTSLRLRATLPMMRKILTLGKPSPCPEDGCSKMIRCRCGLHLDHSVLTGLCSAMYLEAGSPPKVVPSPSPASGLYIKTRGGVIAKVNIPAGCLAFQTGEALEIATEGRLRATPHFVHVGQGGENASNVSRETFALFMQPKVRKCIASSAQPILIVCLGRSSPCEERQRGRHLWKLQQEDLFGALREHHVKVWNSTCDPFRHREIYKNTSSTKSASIIRMKRDHVHGGLCPRLSRRCRRCGSSVDFWPFIVECTRDDTPVVARRATCCRRPVRALVRAVRVRFKGGRKIC